MTAQHTKLLGYTIRFNRTRLSSEEWIIEEKECHQQHPNPLLLRAPFTLWRNENKQQNHRAIHWNAIHWYRTRVEQGQRKIISLIYSSIFCCEALIRSKLRYSRKVNGKSLTSYRKWIVLEGHFQTQTREYIYIYILKYQSERVSYWIYSISFSCHCNN